MNGNIIFLNLEFIFFGWHCGSYVLRMSGRAFYHKLADRIELGIGGQSISQSRTNMCSRVKCTTYE